MIQTPFINEWRQIAPWSEDAMVEQDLVISRLLIELFQHPDISESLAFHGLHYNNLNLTHKEQLQLFNITQKKRGKR